MGKVMVVAVEPEKGKIFSREMCNCLEKMIADFFFLKKMRVTSNKKGAVFIFIYLFLFIFKNTPTQ